MKTTSRHFLLVGLFLLGFANSETSDAATIQVISVKRDSVMVRLNKSAPILMMQNSSVGGIWLTALEGRRAQFVVQGGIRWLTAGDIATIQEGTYGQQLQGTPVTVKSAGFGVTRREVRVTLARNGNYEVPGTVNGFPVRFAVDTGASVISMSRMVADRAGVVLNRRGIAGTASDVISVRLGYCREITVGAIRLEQVECSARETDSGPSALDAAVLLGNSFLSRIKTRQENGVMILTQE